MDADGLVQEGVELVTSSQHLEALLYLVLALLKSHLAAVDQIDEVGELHFGRS